MVGLLIVGEGSYLESLFSDYQEEEVLGVAALLLKPGLLMLA